ncbi:ribonuclease Z [Flavobacterium arcticum]|uniref:Ribonuclease Z n=1 Tax=Flavobacterium arcticum TaxID=1784713 RepID=A0A345HCX9_9FLAO|nr:ribonuclease Z [Flavobacterium arcticum]AXG74439.1 ribonuclease Z [Flavobacterium arcticum]KAF2512440.1 ribonuclease Z [Flavobacterium arcticum]
MKVEEKGHTITIKDTQGDIATFLEKVTSGYVGFKEHNIIIDLTQYNTLTLQEVVSFLSLSNKHREAKKSFVIVVNDFDFNEAPDEMVIVPTLLEAHDMIEMEEIERDLGF